MAGFSIWFSSYQFKPILFSKHFRGGGPKLQETYSCLCTLYVLILLVPLLISKIVLLYVNCLNCKLMEVINYTNQGIAFCRSGGNISIQVWILIVIKPLNQRYISTLFLSNFQRKENGRIVWILEAMIIWIAYYKMLLVFSFIKINGRVCMKKNPKKW